MHESLSTLRYVINWERIRAFGELQILTRVSYFALLIVPLIAGLWPAVRVTINQYNHLVTKASDTLDQTHDRVTAQLAKLDSIVDKFAQSSAASEDSETLRESSAALRESSHALREQVDQFTHDFSPDQLDLPSLPAIWLYAFFGSLSVIVGHTIYQATAPDLIKQFTRMEFIDKARQERATTKATHADLEAAGKEAEERYVFLARSGVFFDRFYALVFYAIGLLCIAYVIYLQSVTVYNAAFPS